MPSLSEIRTSHVGVLQWNVLFLKVRLHKLCDHRMLSHFNRSEIAMLKHFSPKFPIEQFSIEKSNGKLCKNYTSVIAMT